jgi:hypothetical protein
MPLLALGPGLLILESNLLNLFLTVTENKLECLSSFNRIV